MIEVMDCGEPLVDLRQVCPEIEINYADKARQKYETTAYARETVAKMLKKAISALPNGVTFVINDAWRPKELQRAYLSEYKKRFVRENPDWSENQILEKTRMFVIDSDDERRAGHLTEAALDIQLWDVKAGRRLAQNNQKLTFSERARSDQPDLARYIWQNRQTLSSAMKNGGFVNYPKEFWHWSYGDVMWAELTGHQVAVYGVIDR